MMAQSRGSAPDDDVAVFQRHSHLLFRAGVATE
jgi:hypothetical protein